jgi:ABC-type hemin transport system substrate-binding protein
MSSGPSSQSKSDIRVPAIESGEDTLIKLQPITVIGASTNVPETAEQVKEKCRQRIDDYKKAIKKNMPLSDQLDMRDP